MSRTAEKLTWVEVSRGFTSWREARVPIAEPVHPRWAQHSVTVTIEPRPDHCDRGRWIAKCFQDPKDGRPLDGQEGWPRYYFDLDRAKAEIQDWVEARLR